MLMAKRPIQGLWVTGKKYWLDGMWLSHHTPMEIEGVGVRKEKPWHHERAGCLVEEADACAEHVWSRFMSQMITTTDTVPRRLPSVGI